MKSKREPVRLAVEKALATVRHAASAANERDEGAGGAERDVLEASVEEEA